jgi:hypothetical protein
MIHVFSCQTASLAGQFDKTSGHPTFSLRHPFAPVYFETVRAPIYPFLSGIEADSAAVLVAAVSEAVEPPAVFAVVSEAAEPPAVVAVVSGVAEPPAVFAAVSGVAEPPAVVAAVSGAAEPPAVVAAVSGAAEPPAVVAAASGAAEPVAVFVAEISELQAVADIAFAFEPSAPVVVVSVAADSSVHPRFVPAPNNDCCSSFSSSVEAAGEGYAGSPSGAHTSYGLCSILSSLGPHQNKTLGHCHNIPSRGHNNVTCTNAHPRNATTSRSRNTFPHQYQVPHRHSQYQE